MALPALALSGLFSLGGSILGGLGKKKAEEKAAKAKYEAEKPTFERNSARDAFRAQLIQAIMRGYNIESLVTPSVLSKLTTPIAAPSYQKSPGGGLLSGAGAFLSGVAPFIGGGGTPAGNSGLPSAGLPSALPSTSRPMTSLRPF